MKALPPKVNSGIQLHRLQHLTFKQVNKKTTEKQGLNSFYQTNDIVIKQ